MQPGSININLLFGKVNVMKRQVNCFPSLHTEVINVCFMCFLFLQPEVVVNCSICGKATLFRIDGYMCRVCGKVYHKPCLEKSGRYTQAEMAMVDRAFTSIGWSCHECVRGGDDLKLLCLD